MLNMLFPLITATYIARVLLASGVGEVSYAQNIVSYFTTIAALGIPNYGTREIAKLRGNRQMTNKLFSELFSINFVSTLICTIAYYILVLEVSEFKNNLQLYCVVGLAIVFNFINVDWFYQGIEEYSYIAKRSFIIKIISLVCILAFVKKESDTIIYALIYCLGIGGNNLFNIINLRKYKIRYWVHDLEIKKHLKKIFILLASVIAVELYTMVDTTMIGVFCQNENVGYYTNAMKLVKILISVITAIGGVLLPRLSYYKACGQINKCSQIVSQVFSVMLFIFVPCEIGLFLVADQIMPLLFGASFIPAISTLRIACLLICTLGFSNLFGTQVLLTFGAEKKLLYCTIGGAVVNIILNLKLIPVLQQNGAAIASVASETLVTALAIYFSLKYIKIIVNGKFIFSLLCSSVCLAIAVIGIQFITRGDAFKLVMSIILGIIVYMGVSIITRNPVLFDLIQIIKKKIGKK